MNKIEFQKLFSPYLVFSLQDILKIDPSFSRRQISRWQMEGFITKIKKGFYAFSNQDLNEQFLFLVANKIYTPSYVSFERALKFYGLIPEEVFEITSISTKKTMNIKTSFASFDYRHIKPSLFWGYHFIEFNKHKFLIADLEKAILDYLYFHPEIKTKNDFVEMRIDKESFIEQADLEKLRIYLQNFKNKLLEKRMNNFLKYIKE